MDRGNPWIAVFHRAATQHGAITTTQAIELGVDPSTFARRVRAEEWLRPYRNVALIPGTGTGLHTRLAAALLAVGDHAAVTAVAALHLHGVVDRVPSRTVLVVPHGRRAPRLGAIRVWRSRSLVPGDITLVDGLRCTVPPRAVLDASHLGDAPPLHGLLIDARQRGVMAPVEALRRAALAPVRLPGRTDLVRAAVAVDAVGADSVLSDLVHRRLVVDGLTPDPHPVAVALPDGRSLHPDVTFAAARVCIEADSRAHHADQHAIDLDHRKDQGYASALWRCLRVGWWRYDHDWAGFSAAVAQQLVSWPQLIGAAGR